MRMFRTFYRITAGCVVVLGLSIIPFFDVLMKNRPDVDHLMLIYFLYKFKTLLKILYVICNVMKYHNHRLPLTLTLIMHFIIFKYTSMFSTFIVPCQHMETGVFL